MNLPGIHHVTAITSDAQANVDFYTGVLGLRLVKLTVNFDDPTSYHLYYGDERGTPGTIMTFFAWPVRIAGGSVRRRSRRPASPFRLDRSISGRLDWPSEKSRRPRRASDSATASSR